MGELIVEGLAIIGVGLTAIGWIGWVTGPRWLSAFGVLGFVAGIIAWVCRNGRTHRVASRLPVSAQVHLKRARLVMMLVFFAMLIVMVASTRDDGVADYPALASLQRYELNSHGRRTTVSRARYIIVSLSFSTGWHAAALGVNLAALYARLYGKEP